MSQVIIINEPVYYNKWAGIINEPVYYNKWASIL